MAGLLILREFLADSLRTPFVYGKSDCVQWVCSYIARVSGCNPGNAFLGLCPDEESCTHYLSERGGLLQLVSEEFAELPYMREFAMAASSFHARDHVVGVVETLGQQFMAIRSQVGWAIKTRDAGFMVVRREVAVLRTWEVLSCHQ